MGNKKILIITGGNKSKIADFEPLANKLSMDVTLASFSEIQFTSGDNYVLRVGETDIKEFGLIYIRMVGKRIEEASLLVNYAKSQNIKIVDRVYETDHFLPSSLSKAVELSKLIDKGVPIAPTFFGTLLDIQNYARVNFGFPFVIKSTSGRKAREVWAPENEEQLSELVEKLLPLEKEGKKFFATQFIYASQRLRVFVIGGRVVGAITRPTKWRKRLGEVEEIKSAVTVSSEIEKLALNAADAVDLDIAGVDIMEDEKTKKAYVIEVNAAPSWKLIQKDTGLSPEEEVLKFINA